MQLALQSVDGVISASVSIEKKRATVHVKKGEVHPQQLIEAVDEMGYRAFLLPQAVETSGKSNATWGSVKKAKGENRTVFEKRHTK